MEPGAGLHEDQPRLQALLRRDLRRAIPRRAGPSLRAGLRPAAGAREAGRAAPVGEAEDGLRQLDERPVPRGRARRLRQAVVPRHGAGQLAHVPGADQAVDAAAEHALRRDSGSRPSLPHIWWGVSVEDRKHGLPRIEHLRARRRPSASCRSSRCWKISARSTSRRHPLGDRRRRERAGARPMQKEWVAVGPRSVPSAGVPFFFKQWGGVQKRGPGVYWTAGPTTRCLGFRRTCPGKTELSGSPPSWYKRKRGSRLV